ncbi:hypothetical protein D3C72_2024070 [compost metagenome]
MVCVVRAGAATQPGFEASWAHWKPPAGFATTSRDSIRRFVRNCSLVYSERERE